MLLSASGSQGHVHPDQLLAIEVVGRGPVDSVSVEPPLITALDKESALSAQPVRQAQGPEPVEGLSPE